MRIYSPYTMLNLALRLGWDVRCSLADGAATLTRAGERLVFGSREAARLFLLAQARPHG